MSLFKTNTAKDYSKPCLKRCIWWWKKTKILKIQKQSEGNIIKNIRNSFRAKKENETIKNGIIRYIKNRFEQQQKDFQKLVRVGNFHSNNYIEYESNESNGAGNKILSIKEYLDEIKPYLKVYIIAIHHR